MKNKINTIYLLSVGLIVFTAICTTLRLVALLTAFDAGVGYFSNNALITYLDRSLLAASIIFGTVALILTPKDSLSKAPSTITVWSVLSSAALGFVFAIFGVLFLILNLPKPSTIEYVAIVGSIISAIYYIYEAIRPSQSSSKRIGAGLIPILALVCVVFIENFDLTIALNSPEKILSTFVFAIGSLFIVQKLKFNAKSPAPRFHLWCAYMTAFLGAYFALGGIVATSLGVLNSTKYLVYHLFSAGLSIYAFVDLFGRISLSKLANTEILCEPDSTI
jgi:hypothetical protein